MQPSYNALIVDSNLAIRGRLKAAMRAVQSFGDIHITGSLDEARRRMSDAPADVVFLSARLGEAAVAEFIAGGKASQGGRDAAYVLVLEGRRDSFSVARSLMEGADGILLEPYSAHSLQEITALAERVRRERHQLRLKLAMRLLVTEIAAQLAQVAQLEKAKMSGGISHAVLREMCSVLSDLDPSALGLYFDAILEIFPKLPPRQFKRHAGGTYRGASIRVRRHCSARAVKTVKSVLVA